MLQIFSENSKMNLKAITISFTLLGITLLWAKRLEAQFELRFDKNETVTWQEAIGMYKLLDASYKEARLVESGTTDAGKPLHLFIISHEGVFDPDEIRKSGKSVLFINNGIHPGESCGIDASLMLARDLLSGKDPYGAFLENTVLVIVPVFNVGGALNRSAYHRANQNGPLEQGFRGNARNLDLNRDFIKLDSKNTRSLVGILREWDPDVLVDTHTSNGADYPYVITLINSHQQRHEPAQRSFLDNTMLPFLFNAMKETPYEMSPYVWSVNRSPDNGIRAFMDYPRYTSGYASLFNTMAFTVETHMFKPFEDRVRSTWHLLRETLRCCSTHRESILDTKKLAWREKVNRSEFTLHWALDTSRFEMIHFRGYPAKSKPGALTGHPQPYYDRSQTWEREIPYFRFYSPTTTIKVPDFYVLPSAWPEVVDRLKLNNVEMSPLSTDTVMEVEVYYIEEYESVNNPYNGHFRHSNVEVRKEIQRIQLMAGDLMIPVKQRAIEYLVQTLEPQGYDSFFSWNFFDEVLFRNEYFSPYIFEETAAQLLAEDSDLKRAFELKREQDTLFASNPYLQLRFIYERSPWSEATYLRYPVYRLSD
jgi:murein tripeptide amidase MpaA